VPIEEPGLDREQLEDLADADAAVRAAVHRRGGGGTTGGRRDANPPGAPEPWRPTSRPASPISEGWNLAAGQSGKWLKVPDWRGEHPARVPADHSQNGDRPTI